VCGTSVELYDDSLLMPECVHQVSRDPDVHFRWGDGVDLAEQEELLFEHAAGPCKFGAVGLERHA
jgi:hypothetical protein